MSPLEVLILYLKLEKNLTLREISRRLCLSHEAIRQHLQQAYDEIKKEVYNEDLSK